MGNIIIVILARTNIKSQLLSPKTRISSYYVKVQKKANATNDFAIGVIPLPTGISNVFSNTNKLIEAGKIIDRAGFTKAGRALMKHGYRENSVFPKPTGKPAQINEKGQKILEYILNHPERKIYQKHTKNLGEVVDIHAPKIGGVRYNKLGEMIGFLEP